MDTSARPRELIPFRFRMCARGLVLQAPACERSPTARIGRFDITDIRIDMGGRREHALVHSAWLTPQLTPIRASRLHLAAGYVPTSSGPSFRHRRLSKHGFPCLMRAGHPLWRRRLNGLFVPLRRHVVIRAEQRDDSHISARTDDDQTFRNTRCGVNAPCAACPCRFCAGATGRTKRRGGPPRCTQRCSATCWPWRWTTSRRGAPDGDTAKTCDCQYQDGAIVRKPGNADASGHHHRISRDRSERRRHLPRDGDQDASTDRRQGPHLGGHSDVELEWALPRNGWRWILRRERHRRECAGRGGVRRGGNRYRTRGRVGQLRARRERTSQLAGDS